MDIYINIIKSIFILFLFLVGVWFIMWLLFLRYLPFFKEIIKFNKKDEIKIILNKKWGYKKSKII